jgi:lysophospholipase L1-like esterase
MHNLIRYKVLLLALLFLSSASRKHKMSRVTSTETRPKIILIGDSITQQSFSTQYHGWGASLADWYGRSADIINRGFSGYNSRWVKTVLPVFLPSSDHDILLTVILLGANDSSSGSQHISLEEYARNIAAIVQHCLTVNAQMEIILVTPPFVDSVQWPDRHPSTTSQYASKVIEIGQSFLNQGNRNIHVINLWQESLLQLPAETIIHKWNKGKPLPHMEVSDLNDGLHFGIQGNEKLFSSITRLLIQQCPHIVPVAVLQSLNSSNRNGLASHFPHWSELVDKSKEETERLLTQWHWE